MLCCPSTTETDVRQLRRPSTSMSRANSPPLVRETRSQDASCFRPSIVHPCADLPDQRRGRPTVTDVCGRAPLAVLVAHPPDQGNMSLRGPYGLAGQSPDG